ncbi:MAG: hypothetical protein ACOC25_07845 [Alkalispirochaetaceae bacterium]
MEAPGLHNALYPGFDRALVERSWTYLCTCGSIRVYDSENVRSQCLKDYPQINWKEQLVPAICGGVETVQSDLDAETNGAAHPLIIRAPKLGVKIPVDLRYAVDDPTEGIAAVMQLLPIEALPETIRFGDTAFLIDQAGKNYEEAIEALRVISERKQRFFTCNEIDHHMFTHVFDNGNYHRSFLIVEV